MWVLLASSRPVTEWWMSTGPQNLIAQADQFGEGNPFERNIFAVLVAIGLAVLVRRAPRLSAVLRLNAPILVFLFYCAVSALWSDYPGIAIKRWVKAFGDFVMIMIVLTDSDRSAAVKHLLARASFVLLPASVLLIKYYPHLAQRYNPFDGTRQFIGAATDKNMLGLTCLVFGVGAAWRVINAVQASQPKPLLAHGVILGMVAWLSWKANSVTSMSAFAMATALMILTTVPVLGRKRAVLHVAVISMLMFAFAALFLHVGSGLVETMGRDSTITGRTELWSELLVMNPNPLFGAGFETFWLGPRLAKLWGLFRWHPNEAHNGYLEVFLNLGMIGVLMLAVLIVTGYRNAVRTLIHDREAGMIRIAYILVALVYSYTEAGFRTMNPVWIAFMLGAMAIPTAATATDSITGTIARRAVQRKVRAPSVPQSIPSAARMRSS